MTEIPRLNGCVAFKEMGRSVPIPDYLHAPMAEYLALCRRLETPG